MTGVNDAEAIRGRRSPTLDEVARTAGVSRATASRAINGGHRVSPAAKAAVESAVRTLGYTPNLAARSLVTQRTDTIGVVVPEPDERIFSDPFFARTLRAVTRPLADRDLQPVLLLATGGDDEPRLLRYLNHRHLDGAIVVSHHRSTTLPDHLASVGLPSVFVGRPWSSVDRVSYVDTDNVEGGRQAAQLLLDRGCRRIGTIAGPADMSAGVDRADGWRAALGSAGMRADALVHSDFTEAGGALAAAQLLDRHPDLDGLFAASDLMAAGALKELSLRGRRVPEDVAVIGYDDLDVPDRTEPPLTTIHNPIAEMAGQAARLLLEQLDGRRGAGPVRVIYPPTPVRRESA
ncbi:LacI family DNA-binding transcriptional regulator [Nocardioides insulae]|uniref:LacI family DNA-binding transcriptional regulator n=1 Tax=Nocardioides insulae TaxID=394734 RepID=UPI00048DF3E0|nr:LacI family DNA-binding transcriptional regulator [Nocardioides insulae]